MDKITFYLPIIAMVLFVAIGIYIHPMGEEWQPTAAFSEEIMALIFGVIAVADVILVPKILMRTVNEAPSKAVAMSSAPAVLSISSVPAVLGFVHYFMYANIYYFIIFIFVGLVTWLNIYRQVEEKLNRVG